MSLQISVTSPGRGIAVCPEPLAAEEAVLALRAGGNAVDAAVRGAFVQMVVNPFMGSPGGMGQALIWLSPEERQRQGSTRLGDNDDLPGFAAGEPMELSFHARAGSRARPAMWAHLVRGRTPLWNQTLVEGDLNDVGYSAIMTPGTIAGLWEMHRRLGRRPWAECVAPAAELAHEGLIVSPALYAYYSFPSIDGTASCRHRLLSCVETRRVWTRADGDFPGIGDRLRNPDVGRLLEAVAEHGADAFYRGSVGARLAADLAANGSTITADDLATYEPLWSKPLTGADVFTILPPGGGLSVLEILAVLEHMDVGHLEPWSPDAVDAFCFATRAALADRDRYVGDRLFVDVPYELLLGGSRAQSWADRYASGGEVEEPAWTAADMGHTTHISVVDDLGTAVSLSQTIATHSGITTPGMGFLWNNCFDHADPIPGRPNSIAPGKARLTGMSPTMLFDHDGLKIVIGAPGGTTIITGIAQTLRNVLVYGMTATEAVGFPRLHAEGRDVLLEGRFERSARRRLEQRSLAVQHGPAGQQPFPLVQLVMRPTSARTTGATPWTERPWDAASDPRGDGGLAWQ